MEFPRVRVSHAAHTIPVWAVEEKCRSCGEPAAHKVEEVSGPSGFHPLTAYLCCGCFEGIAGSMHGRYPYELNEPAAPAVGGN